MKNICKLFTLLFKKDLIIRRSNHTPKRARERSIARRTNLRKIFLNYSHYYSSKIQLLEAATIHKMNRKMQRGGNYMIIKKQTGRRRSGGERSRKEGERGGEYDSHTVSVWQVCWPLKRRKVPSFVQQPF